ncbi:alpha/beta fold hydrolase [Streptomyces yunnanensis]|uniref:Alpha/beta fold hydrolase n=1 Tax=Streptomyces yunnanensis TaxID=156453 RepID=A0ABY8AAJ3_9ACTN|nr:alpha/beta fold hydrolase [Streptomyces yunnanensis]WEB40706.1 alpha/beta fold hydrolase [Streptomyces yunnanensis]
MAIFDEFTGLWVREFHPASPAAATLSCFPHAGGSASFYFPFSRQLSPALAVRAVQYPGRQDRLKEPREEDLLTLARRAFEALRPITGARPALFGHSMGAVLAFEVARMLEQEAGVTPAHLFVSGRRAPSIHRPESVHRRDDAGLVAEVRRLAGTDSQALDDEEILRMALPAIRGDYKAIETYVYRPGPPLSCPITSFIGDEDPRVSIEDARAWREHTTGEFDMKVFTGGHFYLNEHREAICDQISGKLLTADSRRPGA